MTSDPDPLKIILDFDAELVARYVEEFRNSAGYDTEFDVVCLQKSPVRPDERHVFQLTSSTHKFALKLDKTAHLTGKLGAEYQKLTAAHSGLATCSKFKATAPVYLSRTGNFIVTEFIDAPTALRHFKRSATLLQSAQIFAKCGAWLNAFHASGPAQKTQFWPGWILALLNDQTMVRKTMVPQSLYIPIIASLTADAEGLKGAWETAVPSHGDLHGNNLIIDGETTYGLDFSEAKHAIASYDVARILLMDLEQDATDAEIGPTGILKAHSDAFFERYQQSLSPDIVSFCIKARMIRTWLGVTPEKYETAIGQRRRYDQIAKRVEVAFAGIL